MVASSAVMAEPERDHQIGHINLGAKLAELRCGQQSNDHAKQHVHQQDNEGRTHPNTRQLLQHALPAPPAAGKWRQTRPVDRIDHQFERFPRLRSNAKGCLTQRLKKPGPRRRRWRQCGQGWPNEL
jgi:hypothetical protein